MTQVLQPIPALVWIVRIEYSNGNSDFWTYQRLDEVFKNLWLADHKDCPKCLITAVSPEGSIVYQTRLE